MPELTPESVLETIFEERNRRRKIWTPTIVIDRMGISRSPVPYRNYDTRARHRAKQILHELWLRGDLLRKTKPDTRNRYIAGPEIAYIRPADATGDFLMPCPTCQQPCLSQGDRLAPCENCQSSGET